MATVNDERNHIRLRDGCYQQRNKQIICPLMDCGCTTAGSAARLHVGKMQFIRFKCLCEISGIRRGVNVICPPLGFYAA